MLQLARGKADHLLFLDADLTLEAAPGALDDLRADAYMVRHSGPSELHKKNVVSGGLDWRYVGVTHEYITAPDERTCERLPGVVIHAHSVGGAGGRWERDLELLEREPDNPRARCSISPRRCATSASSRADDDCSPAPARRTSGGRRWVAGRRRSTARCTRPAFSRRPADCADLLTAAWERRPRAAGGVFDLGGRAATRRPPAQAAHRFTSLAGRRGSCPCRADDLHVAPWVYRWGLLFEYSISAYWVGEHRRRSRPATSCSPATTCRPSTARRPSATAATRWRRARRPSRLPPHVGDVTLVVGLVDGERRRAAAEVARQANFSPSAE